MYHYNFILFGSYYYLHCNSYLNKGINKIGSKLCTHTFKIYTIFKCYNNLIKKNVSLQFYIVWFLLLLTLQFLFKERRIISLNPRKVKKL